MNRGFNFWPLSKLDPPFCKLLFGGSNVATKLFNTVTQLGAAGVYAAAAAEDVQVDLVSAGADVTVDFPAEGIEGQCIGVTLKAESPGLSIAYTGAVDVLVPGIMTRSGDCDLFTWDADLSVWALIASFRQGRPFNNVTSVECNEDTTAVEPGAGDAMRIVLGAGVDQDIPVTMPVGEPGQALLLRLVVNNSSGFVVTYPGGELRYADDSVLFVYDGTDWQPVLQQRGFASRGYGMAFTAADMSGTDLAVAHLLDTQAPVVAVYDDTGALVLQGAGGYTVQVNNGASCTLSFDAGLVPISGTWHLNVVGFPI